MSTWGEFGDWIATLAVASFAWISSVIAPGAAGSSPAINASPADQNQLSSMMSWAQQEDEPPIEQVNEDTGEDVETLDETAPPADQADTAEDIELLDQGPPASAVEDVELLDQGPPAMASGSEAPSTLTTVPVTTDVTPAVTTGPFVPEGFGTGNVQVSTGSAGFPVRLEDCHVGAVTGRAYVGIDCGEGGESSFVGHAPSFEEFPFVLDEGFPFNRESVFAEPAAGQFENSVETLVSAARGAPLDDETAPVIRTSGTSSVEFEQRANERSADVESENGRSARGKDSRGGGNAGVTSSDSQGKGDDRAHAESAHGKKQKHGKDNNRGGSAKDNGKKSKSPKHAKNHGGKKDKKRRTS